jgi:hypothetical protein
LKVISPRIFLFKKNTIEILDEISSIIFDLWINHSHIKLLFIASGDLLREMDDGLLPNGNRHTRHLTTFFFFFLILWCIHPWSHTHTRIYTLPSVYFYFIDCKKRKGSTLMVILNSPFWCIISLSFIFIQLSFHSKLE